MGVQSSAEYQPTDTVVHSWSKAGLEVACELIFVADNLKLLKKLKKIVFTHTHTNNYIICLDLHNIETKTVVSAALARTHRITQYHKLHGGGLHRELPKPRKPAKIGGWSLARVWVLARDNTVIKFCGLNFCDSFGLQNWF